MFERSTERVRSVLVSAKKEEGTLFHCFVSSLHRAPRRDAAVVTAAWVAVMLLAACGAAGSSSPSHHAQQQLSKSLMPWSAFPVNARLRPLVFVGPLVVDPSSGFRNGADKIAYIEGAIVAPGTFPPGPTESAGYPIISAKVAFGIFKSRTVRGLVANHHLSVIAVRFGIVVFQTTVGLVGYRPGYSNFRTSGLGKGLGRLINEHLHTTQGPHRSPTVGERCSDWSR